MACGHPVAPMNRMLERWPNPFANWATPASPSNLASSASFIKIGSVHPNRHTNPYERDGFSCTRAIIRELRRPAP